MHSWQSFPALSAVLRTEQIASLLVLNTPGSRINRVRMIGIDRDMVEHIVIALTHMGETRPVMAAVFRHKNGTSAGSEVNLVRILGVIAKAADIAAIRTQN